MGGMDQASEKEVRRQGVACCIWHGAVGISKRACAAQQGKSPGAGWPRDRVVTVLLPPVVVLLPF